MMLNFYNIAWCLFFLCFPKHLERAYMYVPHPTHLFTKQDCSKEHVSCLYYIMSHYCLPDRQWTSVSHVSAYRIMLSTEKYHFHIKPNNSPALYMQKQRTENQELYILHVKSPNYQSCTST